MTFLSSPLHHFQRPVAVAALRAGLGLFLLLAVAVRADKLKDPAAANTAPKREVAVELAGMPSFLYAADPFNFSVRIENRRAADSDFVLEYREDAAGAAKKFPLKITAGGEQTVVISSCLPATPPDKTAAALKLLDATTGSALWQETVEYRRVQASLDDVALKDRVFRSAAGARIVLVTVYEDEEAYRKWLPLRRLGEWWGRREAKRLVWAPPWLTRALTTSGALAVADAVTAANPAAALLEIDRKLPAKDPVVVLLVPGWEEISDRYSLLDFTRGLDILVDRIRARNPQAQVILATPPPVPVEDGVSEQYAAIVRKTAQDHHTGLIDLHAEWKAAAAWETRYAVDGDPKLLGRDPNPAAAAQAAARLRSSLP